MTSALTILSQALVYALPQRWIARLLRYPEAVKFLLIATAGTMATTTLFSILKWTALTDNPVTAHMLAALISAVYAYILCLAWSFADIDHASGGRWAATFFALMAVSITLGAIPLWIARYHLELREPHVHALTETASDFVASTVVGAFLSTWFLWHAWQRVRSTSAADFDAAAVPATERLDPPA
ncbi:MULTISPECIES: GtrA family protein [Actinomycetes]|uniref:GtrA family protein n=3 Tax=Rhodococcus erythropolis group TaxID=2840174 RepID=A0AB38RP44_RHOSG|nr:MULTISPECIES: GtrA family protein [Rhodococcus]EEN85667.1 hypothetical protein RHOER0001_5647 [Rhodococcus erythropolis SK121]MCY4667725.1 GtrA family protein [Rhodococcus sp. (in: high G+C Gram-positive bacteria)]AUS35714.1 hypothetical protein C1M55_31180 [Rhodococcus qingshengii]KZF17848.1 hypothetical protein A2J01_23255 [Rhodococcus sp. EPR-134]MBF7737299.1 GtrA family protein [Rhodococcus erythropolis]